MKKIIAIMVSFAPAIAFAQTAPVTDVNTLTSKIIGIFNIIAYLMVALAVLYIIWNVIKYLIKSSGDEGKSAAGMNILWGIVGLFVIVSIWGLVNILTNTFKTTPTNQAIPNFGNSVGTGGIPGNQIPQVQ